MTPKKKDMNVGIIICLQNIITKIYKKCLKLFMMVIEDTLYAEKTVFTNL